MGWGILEQNNMKNPIKMRTNLLVMLVTETFLFFLLYSLLGIFWKAARIGKF